MITIYQDAVREINDLKWKTFNPHLIVFISWITSVEFAFSLRRAQKVYPDSAELKLMLAGELNTDNLSFGTYINQKDDHWRFLNHFIYQDEKLAIFRSHPEVKAAASKYWQTVRKLTPEQQGMTIWSREKELPQIFENILASHEWSKYNLEFYEYYLRRHIELDSAPGGHGELVENFPQDDQILLNFYLTRLELYKLLVTIK